MTDQLAIANAVVITMAGAWIVARAVPSSRALRLRNAVLLRRGQPVDFQWTPAAIPPDFRVERAATPPVITEALRAAGVPAIGGDWPKARALVEMLLRNWQRDHPIQSDLATTYLGIEKGLGYCSDYVRVFIGAANGLGIFCRQWAFSFDGFGGHGHTFVEIFDRERGAWVFLDVHNNVYAVLAGSEVPLSGLELRQALLTAPAPFEFRRAAPGRLGFPDFTKLAGYFQRGAAQWYLWWGNDVISREQSWYLKAIAVLSRDLAHRFSSVLGRLPPIVALATKENDRAIRDMERLRRSLFLVLGVCGFFTSASLAHLVLHWFAR
jgi:hypothetical protein